ncbi:MAG: hypothetical protein AAF170_04165 [Bacteroidota bacterium]
MPIRSLLVAQFLLNQSISYMFESSLLSRLFGIFFVVFLLSNIAIAQVFPSYEVIFDNFDYSNSSVNDSHYNEDRFALQNGISNSLFGENAWMTRSGIQSNLGPMWYYYNWRWDLVGEPDVLESDIFVQDGRLVLRNLPNHAAPADSTQPQQHPNQVQSGFRAQTGTWAVKTRIDNLDNLGYWTQAFWVVNEARLASSSSPNGSGTEFNFEYTNWFSIGTNQTDDNSDDEWWVDNKWAGALHDAGSIDMNTSPIPVSKRWLIPYMANGVRMDEISSETISASDPRTRGGVPYQNPANNSSPEFSCYVNDNGSDDPGPNGEFTPVYPLNGIPLEYQEERPDVCRSMMFNYLRTHQRIDVILSIHYDGSDVRFGILALSHGRGFARMEGRAALDRRAQPLTTTLDNHTNSTIQAGRNVDFEFDWFYYADDASLDGWDIYVDVGNFQGSGLSRVNTDGRSLRAPNQYQMGVSIYGPSTKYNYYHAVPIQRQSNGIHLEWQAAKALQNGTCSSWFSFAEGSFALMPSQIPAVSKCLRARLRDDYAAVWGQNPNTWYYSSTLYLGGGGSGAVQSPANSPDQEAFSIEMGLSAPLPNPTQAQALLVLSLPTEANVLATAYDALGRQVAIIESGTFESGNHVLKFNGDGLPTGTYTVQAKVRTDSEHRVFTRQVTIIQ